MSSPYFDSFDYQKLSYDYPTGAGFIARYSGMSRQALEDIQQERFKSVLECAWDTPLYRSLWLEAGIKPTDVTDLSDITKLPMIDKSVILADIEAHPPFGSLPTRIEKPRTQRVLQTTSGTTGNPQPVLWGPWGREVQNALLGRTYTWLGVNATDVMHSVYGHGLVNGGHYIREAATRYTEALMLTAGTGIETRSERQVAVMSQFGVTVLVGFADYLLKLSQVARDSDLVPGTDIPVRMIIGHVLDGGREALEKAWGGAKVYNWYGVADTGIVATEGPERDGMHVWEDANYLEIISSPDSGDQMGDMVVTSLGKNDLAPLIRFNTHDLTALHTSGSSDFPFQKIVGLLGRSDNMVKLKGINVYPTAIGGMLQGVALFTGEYVCRVEHVNGIETLTVVIEVSQNPETLHEEVKQLLAQKLGVTVEVELVASGQTAELTGLNTRQKPARLLDLRK
jgi:phenylacetate-CoA ligase